MPRASSIRTVCLRPADVRHRAFAQQISVSSADAYFKAIRRTGGGTTDGAQGAAFSSCVGAVHVADATDSRLAMGACDSCSRCAKGQIVVHHTHFLKSGDAHTWNASWRSLTRRRYTPTPLPEYTVTLGSAPVRISRPRHIAFGSGRTLTTQRGCNPLAPATVRRSAKGAG